MISYYKSVAQFSDAAHVCWKKVHDIPQAVSLYFSDLSDIKSVRDGTRALIDHLWDCVSFGLPVKEITEDRQLKRLLNLSSERRRTQTFYPSEIYELQQVSKFGRSASFK